MVPFSHLYIAFSFFPFLPPIPFLLLPPPLSLLPLELKVPLASSVALTAAPHQQADWDEPISIFPRPPQVLGLDPSLYTFAFSQ